MIDLPELVFVYGTLRDGGSNHFRMVGAQAVGAGHVRGKLYGIDWYPGLVLDAEGERVLGEVYAVGAEQMAALDAFEGLPVGELIGPEYRRVQVPVETAAGDVMVAWVWEWTGAVNEERRVRSGDWLAGNAGN